MKSRSPRRTLASSSPNAWQSLTQGETKLWDVPFPMIPTPSFSHHSKSLGAKFKSASNREAPCIRKLIAFWIGCCWLPLWGNDVKQGTFLWWRCTGQVWKEIWKISKSENKGNTWNTCNRKYGKEIWKISKGAISRESMKCLWRKIWKNKSQRCICNCCCPNIDFYLNKSNIHIYQHIYRCWKS